MILLYAIAKATRHKGAKSKGQFCYRKTCRQACKSKTW